MIVKGTGLPTNKQTPDLLLVMLVMLRVFLHRNRSTENLLCYLLLLMMIIFVRFLNPALYKAAEESPSAFQAVLPKTYNFTGTPLEATLGTSYKVLSYDNMATETMGHETRLPHPQHPLFIYLMFVY